jgi:cytochrome c-type biogenesis protein CcmH
VRALRKPARAGVPGLLLVAAIGLIAAGSALAAEQRTSLPDVEDEVMCPICGTLLELSDSPQADRERALIRRLIARGRSKEQVKAALVAEYGREVLAVPDASGFDLSAWLVPAFALGGMALAFTILILRRRRGQAGSVPVELDPDEDAALERDMTRYDL